MQIAQWVASAQRADLAIAFGLAGTMLNGVGKLAELNARFTRSTLKNAWESVAGNVERPQDWMAPPTWLAAPLAERAQAYSRECFEIVSSTQVEVLRVVREEGEAYAHRIQALIEDATKDAPSGSEAALAALNSAIIAANNLYQSLGQTGQQAAEVARSNLEVTVAAASKRAKRAIEHVQQAAKR